MAEIGTVLGAAQTLFAALECSILKDLFYTLGYKSQIEDLKSTVETVKSVLLDAAASDELTHAARDYVEKLKAAVYDADDLFDEFRTLAERNQQQLKAAATGNILPDKVRLFFSSENPLKVAYKMSREINKIRKNLNGISHDHTNFGSATVDSKRITRNRREETCSYVYAPNVIGREADVKAIVDKLLDSSGEKRGGPGFISVVGIGGMGKTTLAQLVCDDQRVRDEYSSNVWWVCVADQDNNPFDKKTILCNILNLATGSQHRHLSLEQVQKNLRRELEGNKYFLVMDDVWNESKVKWMEMKEFLMLGAAESRIMVTTRSRDVAEAIGDSDIHMLQGLSDENSWSLFEMTAFERRMHDSQENSLRVDIGKKIVKQCSNVPLAIKVVGSLLCGQDISKWQSFEKSGFCGIRKGDNQIMSVLKFSYHNLEPSLKSCFSYCALFPKDFRIKKEMLIRQWMAQGYIVPFDRGQSIEEASEEHFQILLRRCFFQDVKMDWRDNIESFKMHDLIHDLAQQVAGHEMVKLSETSNLSDKVRHVFEGSRVQGKNLYRNAKVRSYLRDNEHSFATMLPLDIIIRNGGCLRTLTLANVSIGSLPDSIGTLLHLRCLDLSHNDKLETLPDSLTKLHNLQTLKLEWCFMLRELPKKFSRLVNLMYLNIRGSASIKHMPVGMGKLTSLCELTRFVAADESSSAEKRVGQLKDLRALVNLKGHTDIQMLDNFKRAELYDWEGRCFEGAQHLQAANICFPKHSEYRDDDIVANDEALLEKLLPPRNVNELNLKWYSGVKFPSWGRADYNLAALVPNLVHIHIGHCRRLKHLPLLSKLKYLESLTLGNLPELEYIDGTICSSSCASSAVSESSKEAEFTLFPSLEYLQIGHVPKLKGWWAGVEFSDISNNARLWQRSFPRLFRLIINSYDNEPCCRGDASLSKIRVAVSRVDILKSLPAGRLSKIRLCDAEMESLQEVGDVINKDYSSLRILTLEKCKKLVHLSGGLLERLTKLESLKIHDCGMLRLEEGEDHGMPWRHLHHNLRSLSLSGIKSLEVLPKGMQYLTSLRELTIRNCGNLQALPEWIGCLSSLQLLIVNTCKKIKSIPETLQNIRSLNQLQVYYCSNELRARCREPDGEDCPKIRHIPYILIQ